MGKRNAEEERGFKRLLNQMLEADKRLRRQGSDLDALLSLIRDPNPASEKFLKKLLRDNGLNKGRLVCRTFGDQEYRGHCDGIVLVENELQQSHLSLAVVGSKNKTILTSNLPKGKFQFFCHPGGEVVVLCKDSFRIGGRIIGNRGRDWEKERCVINPDGSIFFKNASGTIHLAEDSESDFRFIPIPDGIRENEIQWTARHPDGDWMFLIVNEEIGWAFGGKERGIISRNFFFPPAFFGMTRRGLIYSYESDGSVPEKNLFFEDGPVYSSLWQDARICRDGVITREGNRLILNGGEKIVYYGSFRDWDICPGAKAVVVREEVVSGVYEFRQIFYD